MCVLTYIGIDEIQEAKNTLRKLVNEEYNIGLNGLLLSRIYCKYDKNKVAYDILEERIGKNNVMPWIEDDKRADKLYIEYRKQDVAYRFEKFLEDLTEKYQCILVSSLKYDLNYKWKDKITWFLDEDSNLNEKLTNVMNGFFKDLKDVGVFVQNAGISWDKYFKKQSVNIANLMKVFLSKYNNIKKYVAEDSDHVFRKKIDIEKCQTIDSLIKELSLNKFVNLFISDLIKIYNESFSVKSAEATDTFIMSIDKWYTDNKINIPSKDKNSEVNENLLIEDTTFFNSDDFVE
jgi:hypothetical protein